MMLLSNAGYIVLLIIITILFSIKLQTYIYNESIYNFQSQEYLYYLWHEYTGQKGSDEIASIIYKFVKDHPTKIRVLEIFADNCSGMIYIFVYRWYGLKLHVIINYNDCFKLMSLMYLLFFQGRTKTSMSFLYWCLWYIRGWFEKFVLNIW